MIVFPVTEVSSRIFPLLHTIGLMELKDPFPLKIYKHTLSSLDKIVEIHAVVFWGLLPCFRQSRRSFAKKFLFEEFLLQEIHFSFDERSAENYLIVMDFTIFFFMCKLLSIFCNDHLILNTKTPLLRTKEPRDYSIITSNVVHRIHGRK